MGDKTPATTQTQSASQPWSQATPLLTDLINKYSGLPTSVTGAQSTALSNLSSSAAGIPNFGDTAASGVSKLFGSDTSPQIGMLGQGYDTLKANLGSTADGSQLNPWSTPGFGDAIQTGMDDITKQVKGVYAASGRDPSGAGSFAGSLGRGLTQGIAPIIQSQYNTNKQNQMNSASTLFNGANTTATGQAGLGQLPLSNIMQGLQGAGMLSGIYTSPAATELAAANTAQNLPAQNLQSILTPALGLGALGTNTTGTSTQTPANNPLANWIGGISAGAGLMFSDERVKEDIHKVGELNDGQNVYTYRYKGDDTPQLGLLAQEVLEHEPEAVHNVGGVLAVDYSLATRRARGHKVGMIDFSEAA